MLAGRLLLFGIAFFLIYKLINYIIKEWRKEDINKKIDEKKELMQETIKASEKVDKEEIKAYKKADKELKEFE